MTCTVAHLVYSFGCGGLERVIVNLINHSSSYDVNHVIITLTPDQEFYALLNEKIEIFCLNKSSGNDIKSHIRLFQLLKRLRPDVLNTYNFGTLEYQVTAALAGVSRRIHSEHGRGGDDPEGKNLKRNLFRRCVLPLLDRFVVVSNDLYNWAKQTLNVQDDKLALVFNGVNLTEFTPSADSGRPYTFCTVGRLDQVKNQALLIDAYALALSRQPLLKQSQLLIAGDGPLFDDLKLQIKRLSLDSQIKLLGYRKDIPAILGNSDVFILSSLYEAMPMTILEAMASKLPVISTRVGGVEHFVTEDQVGTLVPSGDVSAMATAIVNFFDNQTRTKELGINGRKLVENHYSMEVMVSQYMDFYQCENKHTAYTQQHPL